jgi:hypothetical protein
MSSVLLFLGAARRFVSRADGDAKVEPSSKTHSPLSQALASALDRLLLMPLIDIVTGYARAPDWTRATCQPFSVGGFPSGVAVDARGRCVLWTEYDLSRLRAMTNDDMKAAVTGPIPTPQFVRLVQRPVADRSHGDGGRATRR